jgi:hypothetical protein
VKARRPGYAGLVPFNRWADITREELDAMVPWPADSRGQVWRSRLLDGIEDWLWVNGPSMSDADAAARLGVTVRTVERWQTFLRENAPGLLPPARDHAETVMAMTAERNE